MNPLARRFALWLLSSPVFQSRLFGVLAKGETQLLRIAFSVASVSMASWILFDPNFVVQHPYAVATVNGNVHVLAVLFAIHGVALYHGAITEEYSTTRLVLEGWLGWGLWFGVGVAEALQQHAPGPTLIAGGGIATFLLLRFPTHYKARDGGR